MHSVQLQYRVNKEKRNWSSSNFAIHDKSSNIGRFHINLHEIMGLIFAEQR